MEILKRVHLLELNTLRVASHAESFCRAYSESDVVEALDWAHTRNLPVSVLGGGSNVILGESICGLVLQMRMRGREKIEETGDEVYVRVSAGENWHDFVEYCVYQGCFGLENLALIPGLVGAAPVQNIGAYGVELEDVFYSLKAMDRKSGAVKTFTREQCRFAYRESIFKTEMRDQYIILSLVLRLSKVPCVNLSYPEVSQYVNQKGLATTPINVMQAVCELRKSKLPNPSLVPNVGSFFKNPVVSAKTFARLKEKYTRIPGYSMDDGRKKIPAAWLIDSLGLKKYNRGGVCLHQNQALVITNSFGASSKEILTFAESIQRAVEEFYGIPLEMEPRCVGCFSDNN